MESQLDKLPNQDVYGFGSDTQSLQDETRHDLNVALKYIHNEEAYQDREYIKDLMHFCLMSTENTCYILFGDRFYKPFSKKIHYPIFEILDNETIQKFCIIAPRGTGKTTLDTIVYPARRLLFTENPLLECPFFVPLGNAEMNAVMQAENLKMELGTNRFINRIFGPIKAKDFELGLDLPFSTKQWVTSKKSLVMPRGRGQAVRGILFWHHRPRLILGDDIEDPEEVRNEIRRKDTLSWWLNDVGKSVEIGRDDWRTGIVGTLLHEDSLLANLHENDAWTSVQLSIANEKFVSNWPEHITNKGIQDLKEEHSQLGDLDGFYREYMSLASSTEDASFRTVYFNHYNETDDAFAKIRPRLMNVVLGDPAKTEKMQSADSAVVGVGFDTTHRAIFLRDCVNGRMYPDEFYDNIIDMGLNLRSGGNCDIVGIETTGLEEFIVKPFKDRMAERGVIFQFEKLMARQGKGEYAKRGRGKEGRVAGLVKYYRQGNIWHNNACCGALEKQLLGFPRSKKWDVMDAFSYITYLMEKGFIYFDVAGPDLYYDQDPREIERMELEQERYDGIDPDLAYVTGEGLWRRDQELGGYFGGDDDLLGYPMTLEDL